MVSEKKQNGIIEKAIAILIVILPMTIYYYFPFTSMNLDTVLVLVIALFSGYGILKKGLFIRNCLLYFLLVAWTVIVSLVAYVLNHYSVNIGIGLWYIVLVYIVLAGVDNDVVDGDYVIKAYSVASKIVILMLIAQWIMLIISGRFISFMLSFMPINADYSFASSFIKSSSDSVCACFSERSHACLYLIPYLCMLLSKGKENKFGLLTPLFVTVVILSTVSGNGVIACAIAWCAYFYISQKGWKKYVSLLLVVALVVCVYYILSNISVFKDMFDILFVNNSGNEHSHTKADYRVYRGFVVFGKLPELNKIFGIGYRTLADSSYYFGIPEIYDYSGEYMNTLAQILVYSGIAGAVAFLGFVGKLFFSGNSLSKVILVCFIALSASSSIYNDPNWILYFSLVLIIVNKQKCKKTG